MLNNILANEVQQSIEKIFLNDQVGMQARFNICNPISIIHHIKRQVEKPNVHDHLNRSNKKHVTTSTIHS